MIPNHKIMEYYKFNWNGLFLIRSSRKSCMLCNQRHHQLILCLLVLLSLTKTVTSFVDVNVFHDATENTKEGDDIDLICTINYSPSDSLDYVQWKRGEVTFSEFNNLTISHPRYSVDEYVTSILRVYTLKISGVQVKDSGLYSCHVGYTTENEQPSAKSKSVELTVPYYTPETSPLCQVVGGTANLTSGSLLSLNCTSELGNPPVNMSWMRLTSSGIVETMPLKQAIYGADIAQLSLTLNITSGNQGDKFVCGIKSNLFSDFHRNCTAGPLLIVDITTARPVTTQALTTTPFLMTTQKSITTSLPPTGATTEPPVSTFQPTDTLTDTVTLTTKTPYVSSANIGLTDETKNSSDSDMVANSPSSLSKTTPISNLTTSGSFNDLSNSSDQFETYEPVSDSWLFTTETLDDPPEDGSGFALIAIIGIAAAGIIVFFLICNLCMLTRLFMREKEDKTYTRTLRSRESVQRVNQGLRREPQTFPTINEETEA